MQQSAILTRRDLGNKKEDHEDATAHSMPSSWVKGTMLVRCNTNIRGHSAIRSHIVDTVAEFLRRDLIPVIPLRGSISASGDLMPLSYIAGAIQGNPDIYVRSGRDADFKVMNARDAMKAVQRWNEEDRTAREKMMVNGNSSKYSPIILGPKEGLALVNGTAPCAAVASLAIYETNQLAILSQLITCLSSEALAGNVEWTHPYIAEVRPHPGQVEVSQNQRSFFQGSNLVEGLNHAGVPKDGMAQDRYSTRTSSQWIGPLLEDLLHASKQLGIELNSTTDNPIVNLQTKEIHCGGNFQSASVTMVAEKIRLCLQMIGKMLFAQTSELINPVYNNGLPPNLAADDPSLSFCLKGVDINMAAYQSEVAFLANPVSSHVQSAEMHNQGINSLALISARYAMQSAEIVQMMCASSIYVGLQAVDLRVMHKTFFRRFKALAETTIRKVFSGYVDLRQMNEEDMKSLTSHVWNVLPKAWYENANSDARPRCEKVAKATVEPIMRFLHKFPVDGEGVSILGLYSDWIVQLEHDMYHSYLSHREKFFSKPTTVSHLGKGTKVLYRFVREELGVPFHRGLVEDPVISGEIDVRPVKTIGSWISVIYEAIKDGRLCGAVLKSMQKDDEGSNLESLG